MSIGELRNRITFQKLVITTNDNGFETEVYEDIKTVWARVSNLLGKEYFSAAAVQKEKTVKFLIRATTRIDETMRILFKDKCYNITSISNIRFENKYMEIKAMEDDADG